MKKTGKIFRWLSLLLVCLLVFTACSQTGDESSSSTGETSEAVGSGTESSSGESSGDETEETAAADGPMGKYDPPIQMVSALSGLDATVKQTDTENPEDNIWLRAYRDELGIEVTNLWAVDGTQGNDKINLAIASQDIPDVFRVNQTQFEQLYQAGLLEDISAVYEEYAGDFMKDVMSREGSDTALQACSRDGKLYGIPYFLNMTDNTPQIWIRKDWLDKLNLEEPESFEDLETIIKAFHDQDPDGDGVDDTLGLLLESTVFNGSSGVFTSFMNCFHAYPFSWVERDGKLVNGLTEAEPMKAGLAKLAELYADGYIRQDFASYSWDDQAIPDMMNGNVGITFGGLWEGWWPLGEMKATDPDVDWKTYPVMSADDEPAKGQSKEIVLNGITVVKKGYEHPEALIKMINLCNEKMWESDEETFFQYGYDAAGNNPWLYCNAYFEFPGKNYTLYQKGSKALEDGNTDDLTGEESLIYGWMKDYVDGTDLSRYGIYLSYGPDSSCAQIDYYLENDLYEYDKFYGNPTESQLDNESILTDMFAEYALNIVTGQYPIDAYDEFIENWYAQGGQQWTDEVNEWYAQQNS